jgi:hypothetical protein
MGCTMPIPPAAETAATSSGLLHGYIAPQISGTVIRACSVSGVRIVAGLLIASSVRGRPHLALDSIASAR